MKGTLALPLLVALAGALPAGPGHAAPPTRALFSVGSGVADLTPAPGTGVYSGGFGQGPAIYGDQVMSSDPLNARAIYISNGTHAVTLVLVDSQGVFAALQEASSDPNTSELGSAGMRADAARAIDQAGIGPAMTDSDIVVQGSHSHSAPTVMGIWGPVPQEYLQLMHDRVVAAIVAAARSARPANLEWGTADAPELDNIYTDQTDSYQGWQQDGQVSVLRAVDPNSGATITTYANVPAHPDIVNGAGIAQGCINNNIAEASCPALTADYFGAARGRLESQLGGTGIVGGATLGREESPIQVGGVGHMENYSLTVTELVERALAGAHWLTDSTVASSTTQLYVPGTNPLLLGLVLAWQAPEPVPTLAGGNLAYPINRSIKPPWLVGNAIGTPVTALRIGSLAYVTLNGEAFPEVRHGIASAVTNADMIVGLSLGNDQLGYYEPLFAWAFANGVAPYHSDHLEYNVSPVLGDEIIQTQVLNLRNLGFTTAAAALPAPMNNDYAASTAPGLQALAYPERGDADPVSGTFTTTLEGIYGGPALNDSLDNGTGTVGAGTGIAGSIHWDLGDGTRLDTPMASGRQSQTFTHAFLPGTWTITLTAKDQKGDAARTWQSQVTVYPPLTASATATPVDAQTVGYAASDSGGQGAALAWHWVFADGGTGDGQSVTHTFAANAPQGATVTVTDGAGGTATASA
ncbi:MAG: PKD domain-containing protein [Candidatus Dormibacteria bacterium]